jgi:outer membrane protein OmpA-like peptidoglycan-associated protein
MKCSLVRWIGFAMLVVGGANIQASDVKRAYGETPSDDLESYRLTTLNRIYFTCGKSDASRKEKAPLSKLVNTVGTASIIELRGYADGAGSTEKNVALGTARAEAVAKLLVDSGIPSQGVRVIGLGAVDPDGPALNPEHQRVDLRVFVAPTDAVTVREPLAHNR